MPTREAEPDQDWRRGSEKLANNPEPGRQQDPGTAQSGVRGSEQGPNHFLLPCSGEHSLNSCKAVPSWHLKGVSQLLM